MITALVVFAISYVLIVARRLHWIPIGRPAGALVGACLAVACRVITPEQAYRAIDLGTLGLLFGMMVINAHLERAGAFDRVAGWLGVWPRGPRALMCMVAVGSGVGAALLVNDAVCLMGTPVVLAIARRRRLHPLPLLLALATGSNVGGVMTLTGTPQCMIVGQLGRISYTSYAAVMVPVGAAALAMLCVVLLLAHRRGLPRAENAVGTTRETLPPDQSLLIPSLLAIVLVTVGFLLRFNLAWTAVAGACFLMVTVRRDASELLARVDWSVLLFFAGLFVVMGGLSHSGAIDTVWQHVEPRMEGGPASVVPFSQFSLVAANLVSNVPYVLLMAPWMNKLAEPRLMWLALSMAATFAGNLTLIGSVANIIVSEGAGPEGGMSFGAYLRVGLPAAILTTLVGAGVLIALHATGWVQRTAGW